MIDEYPRECLAIERADLLLRDDVLECLTALFTKHGPPDHIVSDGGRECTAATVRKWLPKVGVKTLYIESGTPRENGYNEFPIGKLRDELVKG